MSAGVFGPPSILNVSATVRPDTYFPKRCHALQPTTFGFATLTVMTAFGSICWPGAMKRVIGRFVRIGEAAVSVVEVSRVVVGVSRVVVASVVIVLSPFLTIAIIHPLIVSIQLNVQ